MMNYSLPLILVCLLGFCSPSLAQEKSLTGKTAEAKQVKVKPSKVSSAKGREREKLFTDWMPQNDLVRLSDQKHKGGEQMIFFEYHEGKRQFRAIFTKSLLLRSWYWDTVYSEKDMEEEVNLYKFRGYEPAFVVLERNFYQILFVRPEQLSEAQKILKDLGVEPPTLK